MAAKQLNVSVLLRASNFLSSPLRAAVRSIEDVDRAAARAQGMQKLAGQMSAVGDRMQRMGAMSMGAGFAAAAATGLTDLPQQARVAQHELRQIGNVADLSNAQLVSANRELRQLAPQVNQFQSDLISGLATLTANGLDFRESMTMLPDIGRTATAQTAGVTDLSNTAFSLRQNLKVLPAELRGAFEVAAQSGQLGAFELKDMARHFATLTASAEQLGMRGVPAVAQLGAALQIARRGAGSNDQAATNFGNFISKLTSPETVKNFKDLGVNLETEWARIARSGKDPILEMVNLINRVAKGNQFRIGDLFGDQQVLQFIKPMLSNLEDYQRIRDESLKASTGGGPIDRNFTNMMSTGIEQSKLLRINLGNVAMPYIEEHLERANAGLTQLNAHPILQRRVVVGIAGLLGLGAASVGIGTAVKVFSPLITVLGKAQLGASLMLAGFRGAAVEGGRVAQTFVGLGRSIRPIGPRLTTAGTKLREFSRLQRLVDEVQFRGGYFKAIRHQASAAATRLRAISGLQRLVSEVEYRGGYFNVIRYQALRARLAIAAQFSAMRAGAAASALRLRQVIGLQRVLNEIQFRGGFYNALRFQALRARLAVLSAAGAVRVWTVATLSNARAHAVSLLSLRTYTAAALSLRNSVLSTAGGLRTLRIATIAGRAASLASAAATWVLNAALLANPITWVVIAFAAAAVLIFKYWKPISGFFRGLWTGLKQGLAPAMPALKAFADRFRFIGVALGWVVGKVRPVIGWFGRLLKPVDDVGGAAENMGVRFGRVLGRMLTFVGSLPAKFLRAGMNIVSSLWEGMTRLAGKPVEAMRAIVTRIRNHLPFSPAKEGPLRDLHRVRLVETLADTIRPGPVVAAMRGVAAAALASGAIALPVHAAVQVQQRGAPNLAASVQPPRLASVRGQGIVPNLRGLSPTATALPVSPRLAVAAPPVLTTSPQFGAAGAASARRQPPGPAAPPIHLEVHHAPVYQVQGGSEPDGMIEALRRAQEEDRAELRRMLESLVREELARVKRTQFGGRE